MEKHSQQSLNPSAPEASQQPLNHSAPGPGATINYIAHHFSKIASPLALNPSQNQPSPSEMHKFMESFSTLREAGKSYLKFDNRMLRLRSFSVVFVKSRGDVDLMYRLLNYYPQWEVTVKPLNRAIRVYAHRMGFKVLEELVATQEGQGLEGLVQRQLALERLLQRHEVEMQDAEGKGIDVEDVEMQVGMQIEGKGKELEEKVAEN